MINTTTGFYPHPIRNGTMKFVHPDDEDSYKSNLLKFGNDWHYANKPVEYVYNSIGYRCKELEYYKDKEFILVMGCSHTEGIGLAEDEVWHTHVSKEFGVEVLNAGFGGSGPDMQLLNTFLFLSNANILPKAVIIQWPNLSRFTFKGDNLKRPLVPNLKMRIEGPDGDSFFERFKSEQRFLEKFYKWWLYDNNDINHSWIFIECTRIMWTLANVTYFDFCMEPDPLYKDSNNLINMFYQIESREYARDQNHYGHKFNLELGKLVCEHLRTKL